MEYLWEARLKIGSFCWSQTGRFLLLAHRISKVIVSYHYPPREKLTSKLINRIWSSNNLHLTMTTRVVFHPRYGPHIYSYFLHILLLLTCSGFDLSYSALQVGSPLSSMIGIRLNFLEDSDFKYSNCYSSVYLNCFFLISTWGVVIDMIIPSLSRYSNGWLACLLSWRDIFVRVVQSWLLLLRCQNQFGVRYYGYFDLFLCILL